MGIIVPGESDSAGGSFVAPPECGLSVSRRSGFIAPGELSAVAKSGFRILELSAVGGEMADSEHMRGLGRQELAKSLRDNDLKLAALRSDVVVGQASRAGRREIRDGLLRLIDSAAGLNSPLAVAGAFCGSSALDSARYALDSLHEVSRELSESGITIAMESTYGDSFLFSPAAVQEFLQNCPENVAAAVNSSDLAGGTLQEGALALFSGAVRLGRLSAEQDAERGITLMHEDFSRKMLSRLSQAGFAGKVLLDLQNLRLSGRELAELHRLAAGFMPSAYMP